MRNQNGYGGVTKLSGKRRKPYMAYKSEMISTGTKTDLENEYNELLNEPTPEKVGKLFIKLHPDNYLDIISKEIKPNVKQKKIAIGYFENRKDALIALAKYNNNPYDIKDKLTFKEVWELVYPTMNFDSHSKTRQYNYDHGFEMCSYLHNKDLAKITIDDLQFIIDQNKGRSSTTVSKPLQVIRAIYKYAVPRGLVGEDVSKYLVIPEYKPADVRIPFTIAEIDKIWSIQDNIIAKYILVLLYTGLRIGELLDLKEEMIEGDIIHVPGTKTDSAKRNIPVHPKIEKILGNVISTNLNYDKFQREYKSLMETLGMKHIIHETRHTFVTFSKDMNPIIRKYIIGHHTNDITDRYTHPDEMYDDMRKEILKLLY